MIPPYVRHYPPGDVIVARDLFVTQDAIESVLNEIAQERRPQLSSEILEGTVADGGIALTTGSENLVQHKLGRAVRGWKLIDIQGNATVWRDTATTSDPEKFLSLQCSGNVTVKLEVF